MNIKPIFCLVLISMSAACMSGQPGTSDAAPLDAANQGCRSASECENGTSCVGPNDVNCGIPPREECQSSQDCSPTDVCHAIADSCSSDGVGSRCGVVCAQPTDCDPGFSCDPQGACVPTLCDQPDVECRVSETCDPASVDANAPVPQLHHGCVTIACTDDAPCPGQTVCVNGYCQDGPGSCEYPAP